MRRTLPIWDCSVAEQSLALFALWAVLVRGRGQVVFLLFLFLMLLCYLGMIILSDVLMLLALS